MPTLSVDARLSERASALGRKPTKAMASSTRLRVSGFTCRVRLTTCETVETETPALRATSTMVAIGGAAPCWRRRKRLPFQPSLGPRAKTWPNDHQDQFELLAML